MLYNKLFLLFLLCIIYKLIYPHSKNELYFRSTILSKKRNKKYVIYLVNPTAGLANTLRGMASTIFMSFLYNTSFFLKGWKSVVYYFNFPIELLYNNNIDSNFSYRGFNKSILDILKLNKVSLLLTDIHGFMDVLIKSQFSFKKISILKEVYCVRKIDKRFLNSIIYREIFIPSKEVLYYCNMFNLKRKKKKVLGIHVRTGIFSNNFTEEYFSRKIFLNLYYVKADKLINENNFSFVFTLSDNEKYLNELKFHFKNIIIDIPFKGDIIHSRFSLYNPLINNNAIRIVSEFIILSTCDYIIGTKMSSFSSESCNRLLKSCTSI